MSGHLAAPWMIVYVIEIKPELLQKSNSKLICIVIPCGDAQLEQFQRFTAPSPYTGYKSSCFIIDCSQGVCI